MGRIWTKKRKQACIRRADGTFKRWKGGRTKAQLKKKRNTYQGIAVHIGKEYVRQPAQADSSADQTYLQAGQARTINRAVQYGPDRDRRSWLILESRFRAKTEKGAKDERLEKLSAFGDRVSVTGNNQLSIDT